ncbi:hypothetical protein [Burkholderia latens]|uniref:hypothetical protein n=1 Tax=Burkholderia latens TaxID=488446 RepID=UPI00158B0663|nr:hypothetical protein [Burkholderia latens]
MLTYPELSARYKSYQDARNEYVCYLQQCIARLATQFEESLGLPSVTWTDRYAKQRNYVELGKIENGEFVAMPASKIEGRDRSIPFALQLTLDASQAWPPATHFVQTLSIGATRTTIEFEIVGEPTLTVGVVRNDSRSEFRTVIEAIVQRIHAALDPDVFMGKGSIPIQQCAG